MELEHNDWFLHLNDQNAVNSILIFLYILKFALLTFRSNGHWEVSNFVIFLEGCSAKSHSFCISPRLSDLLFFFFFCFELSTEINENEKKTLLNLILIINLLESPIIQTTLIHTCFATSGFS